jgi:glutaconate CoA-transferase subunit B
MDYTTGELIVSVLSRALKDEEVAIMGAFSAIPMLSCRLAQLTHAPNLSYIAGGSGAINPKLEPLVASSCDFALLKSECVVPLSEIIDFEARTEIDVFFAGGLQVDRKGNCNLVCVGDYDAPKVRGPGTVGLAFLSRARRYMIYTMTHSKRTFVEKVDFVSGGGSPSLIVTPLCVMGFDQDGSAKLVSVHPNVDTKDVIDNTGFELSAENVGTTKEPGSDELEIMRTLDPLGVARYSVR